MPPKALSPLATACILLISMLLVATLAGMVGAWSWAIGRLRSGRPILPGPKPHPVPWGTGSVLIVFLTWLAVNVGVATLWIAGGKLAGFRALNRTLSFAEQMAVVSLINGVLLVIIPAILRLTSRATLKDLGLGATGVARPWLDGTVGFLLVSPTVYLLNGLAVLIWEQNKHPLEKMVMAEPTLGIACLAFLSAVVLAPAAEELIFRGIIQGWLDHLLSWQGFEVVHGGKLEPVALPYEDATPSPLGLEGEDQIVESEPLLVAEDPNSPASLLLEPIPLVVARRKRFPLRSPWAPIVLTSALFAAVHLPQWPAPIAIFFLSLGLGLVYQRTGNLVASYVMHALFNGFSTMLLFQVILVGPPAIPKEVPPVARSAKRTPQSTPVNPAAMSSSHVKQ